MKSKKFNVTELYTRSLLRVTGLTTGYTRTDLVHSCKYQEFKAMCRLPDIHKSKKVIILKLKHINEAQGTII